MGQVKIYLIWSTKHFHTGGWGHNECTPHYKTIKNNNEREMWMWQETLLQKFVKFGMNLTFFAPWLPWQRPPFWIFLFNSPIAATHYGGYSYKVSWSLMKERNPNFFLNPPFKNNNKKKQSKSNMSHKLRLGVIIIIIRNKKSPNLRLGLLLPGMEWTLLRVLKLQCMVGEQQKITRVCTIKMSLFTVTDLIIIIRRRNGTKTNSFGNLIRRNGANTICLSNFVWGT